MGRGALPAATRLDEFAELLSRDLTPSEAAKRMGLKRQTGHTMFKRLCARLGPQAV